MIAIGSTAKSVRERLGITQREAAERLGITPVHLCNVENNKSPASSTLLDKYEEIWGVDLYVLAWCERGDVEKLPKSVRDAAKQLKSFWIDRVAKLGQQKSQ
ncbi:MAG: hypothetical protein JWN70_3177 [Planctomycetaceae bacterium]|nr:hypothetical protein [Planctomycetaceae bacterium]